MTLLLDTHTFLWFAQGDASLSPSTQALLEDPANRKLVSVASCWEIAIKAGLGKLRFGEPAATYIPRPWRGRVSSCYPSAWRTPRVSSSCPRTTRTPSTGC